MATSPTPAAERENYLNTEYGIRSWLLTTDHKRIALLYLVSITFFFFIGGAAAVLALRVLYPDVTPADAAEVVLPRGGPVDVAIGMLPESTSRE